MAPSFVEMQERIRELEEDLAEMENENRKQQDDILEKNEVIRVMTATIAESHENAVWSCASTLISLLVCCAMANSLVDDSMACQVGFLILGYGYTQSLVYSMPTAWIVVVELLSEQADYFSDFCKGLSRSYNRVTEHVIPPLA